MTKTMTLNLSEKEMAVVEQLAASADLSKTSVIRQALRWYQFTQHRVRAGERVFFSGDEQRAIEFVGPGFQTWPPYAPNDGSIPSGGSGPVMPVSGRSPSGRATHEPSRVSPSRPVGDHPSRVEAAAKALAPFMVRGLEDCSAAWDYPLLPAKERARILAAAAAAFAIFRIIGETPNDGSIPDAR